MTNSDDIRRDPQEGYSSEERDFYHHYLDMCERMEMVDGCMDDYDRLEVRQREHEQFMRRCEEIGQEKQEKNNGN